MNFLGSIFGELMILSKFYDPFCFFCQFDLYHFQALFQNGFLIILHICVSKHDSAYQLPSNPQFNVSPQTYQSLPFKLFHDMQGTQHHPVECLFLIVNFLTSVYLLPFFYSRFFLGAVAQVDLPRSRNCKPSIF